MFILPSGVLKIGIECSADECDVASLQPAATTLALDKFPGDFGLSVSIRRRTEGVSHGWEGVSHSWEGMAGGTPHTGLDAAFFGGHLGSSVGGEGAAAESSGHPKPDVFNSSGEDLSSMYNSSLGRGHDVSAMSRDGNSRDTSALSVYQQDISVVAGTAAYAPPHPTGSFADDLYSVAVVFYELLNLFKTSMQRVASLRDLRASGTVSAAFRALFPRESAMIEEVGPFPPGTINCFSPISPHRAATTRVRACGCIVV